jgi:hypothetical protein
MCLSQRLQIRKAAGGAWNSRAIAFGLLAACAALALWAIYTIPSPGTSVAILGGVAALMTTRTDMRPLEKAGYIAVITILLVAEIAAIRKNDAEIQNDRLVQNRNYQTLRRQTQELRDQAASILSNTETVIKDGQVQFKETTSRLRKEEKSLQTTVDQTGPHADLQYKNLLPGEGEGPNPKAPPLPFVPDRSYHLWVLLNNAGNDTATLRSFFGKTYVAKPIDKAAQKTIEEKFEDDWRTREMKPTSLFSPGQDGVSEMNTTPLSEADIVDIKARRKALYYLMRFEFSDKKGIWFSDYCFGIQNPGQYLGLSWPCWEHNRVRYKPKQR